MWNCKNECLIIYLITAMCIVRSAEHVGSADFNSVCTFGQMGRK